MLAAGLGAALAASAFVIAPRIGAGAVPTLAQAVSAFFPTVDVLLLVIGAYQAPRDVASDLEEFSLELQLADLGQIDKRLERLEKELRLGSKGTPQERAARERELAVLRRLRAVLVSGQPARSVALSKDEQKDIASFGFLTQKPTLVVANLADDQPPAEVLARLQALVTETPRTAALAVPARLEMELSELAPDEAAEFKEALGVGDSQLGEIIRTAYGLADLTSFFTAGEDECRAWTIPTGATAQEAAGAIHSDLARGFIRAEVIRWDQLLEAGSEAAAKRRGWVRQEGKTYVVQDGDVLHVLFNV